MHTLKTVGHLLLLASAGGPALATHHAPGSSGRQLGRRTYSPCQFTPFFCDLGVTTANAYRVDYSTLTFDPSLTAGNPTTAKLCFGNDCATSGTVSLEIRGTPETCVSGVDPTVVITFSGIAGIKYVEEQIYVGATPPPKNPNPGGFPFTTGKGYCDPGGAVGSHVTCSIPLSQFLAAAGITSPCAGNPAHSLVILTHAKVQDAAGNNPATGTSEGTCVNDLNGGGKCAPWFKYATLKYSCAPCKLCNSCDCPAWKDTHKCECIPTYPDEHPCECPQTQSTCKCPSWKAAHPCDCDDTKITCACSIYANANPCECIAGYPAAHPCECPTTKLTCACPDWKKANPCLCEDTKYTCACPDWKAANPCLCEDTKNTCACPDWKKANPCLCEDTKNTCACPDWKALNPCLCEDTKYTCACPDWKKANPCLCEDTKNTCACPDWKTANPCLCEDTKITCACPDWKKANPCQCDDTKNTCDCSIFANANPCTCVPGYPAAHICECPTTRDVCQCPVFAAANPDKCTKWCPDTDTAYGYFRVPPNPVCQSQFNLANRANQKLAHKNCQSKWGWWDTFVPAELANGASYTGDLVAGAGNYNLGASKTVGTFTISVSAGKALFGFTAATDYQFGILHIQAGCAIPATCAPGQFNNPFTRVLGGTGADSGASTTGLQLNLGNGCSLSSPYTYFIIHASVAKKIPYDQTCPGAVPQ